MTTKYATGLHNYEPNSAPTNEYTAGEFASYLGLLGLGSAAGAVCHAKLKDQAGQWRGGTVPGTWGTGGHNSTFITEAKAAGAVTLGAWMFLDEDNLPWTEALFNDPAVMAQFDAAAAACVSTYPNVDIWLFGNEREGFGISTSDGDAAERARWTALEARAGAIWRANGRQWAAGADQSIAHFFSTLDERRDAYDSEPDYWVLHAYANGGFSPRHVRDVRRSLEARVGYSCADKIIYAEIGPDFEPGATYGSKAWIRDYRARDWWEHVGRALRRERSFGCYFNMKAVMRPWDGITTSDTTKYVIEGMLDSVLDTVQNAEPPARLITTASAVTRRYLLEGTHATNEWGATWQAAREYARNLAALLVAPNYWADQ